MRKWGIEFLGPRWVTRFGTNESTYVWFLFPRSNRWREQLNSIKSEKKRGCVDQIVDNVYVTITSSISMKNLWFIVGKMKIVPNHLIHSLHELSGSLRNFIFKILFNVSVWQPYSDRESNYRTTHARGGQIVIFHENCQFARQNDIYTCAVWERM